MGNRPAQHANPPLSGINVLDLTNVISGPYCCFHLGLMGAAVLKVEQPAGGDMGRRLGAGAELKELDMGSLFLAQNAGKRSMTLNLKHPRGRDVFLRLARQADVLVENFRPGVMSRLGLDYETLREHNAGLVYCSISGFGQESPLKDNPAFDQIVQGLSGAMGTTGTVASGPLRAGYPISDTVGGLNAAFAISSALLAREKTRSGGDTGGGQFIDVSLLDATMSAMGWAVSNVLISGEASERVGNDNFAVSPSGSFQARDISLNIAANTQQQYERLCTALGREELIADQRFAGGEERLKNRAALKAELEQALGEKAAEEWVELLNRAGVPAGLVLDVPQALQQPHITSGGFVQTLRDVPGLGRDIEVLTSGYRLPGAAPLLERPPPLLGAHTDQVLEELGYSAGDITGFREDGVI